jgi:excinuclease UvrABC ATPase subunit
MDKDENKNNLEEQIKSLKENIQKDEESKEPFEKEMLNILKNHGKIDELDPIKALEFANDHWNVCADNEFFDYLMDVVKEYTVSGNEYKITKNLSEIGLIYKEKEAYDYKKKNVTIDSDKACDLCKKKIGPTLFVVYPNLKVYHAKCAPNANIDPMTGVDFSKKKYVE